MYFSAIFQYRLRTLILLGEDTFSGQKAILYL